MIITSGPPQFHGVSNKRKLTEATDRIVLSIWQIRYFIGLYESGLGGPAPHDDAILPAGYNRSERSRFLTSLWELRRREGATLDGRQAGDPARSRAGELYQGVSDGVRAHTVHHECLRLC